MDSDRVHFRTTGLVGTGIGIPRRHRAPRARHLADEARASLDALGQRLRTLYGIKVNWTIRCATLDDDLRGDVKPVVLFAFCAVGLVFLIACANLANLMLARSTERRREFALRLAIGAAPRQIRAQSLVEATTLAAIGGATGLMLAIWLSPLPPQLGARAGLAVPDAGVDLPVGLFALAATLASALIMSILSLWQVSRASLSEPLSHAGRGSPAWSSGRPSWLARSRSRLSSWRAPRCSSRA